MIIQCKLRCIICIAIAVLMLSGCAVSLPKWPTAEPEPAENDPLPEALTQITSLGLTPDLNYDKPVVESHIETDQLGYLPGSRKIAVFRGNDFSGTFNVINADTGESVYTGDIKSKLASGTNELFFYGDFTDLSTEGSYYVQTDVIGYSYPFRIASDIYDDLFDEAVRQYYLNRCGVSLTGDYAGESARSACHTEPITLQQDGSVQLDVSGGWHLAPSGDRDVCRGCSTMEALLMAYEYNTDSFGDEVGIPESGDGIPDILNELRVETDWLLKMQDQSTGAVYSGIFSTDKGLGFDNPCYIAPADLKSTLNFAATLGYFGYIYQTVDAGYATTCLQAADRAMKYASRFTDSLDDNEYFRAAAMLYRATGYTRYHSIITEYHAGHGSYDISDNVIFSGVVTYLATKQKTDSGICNIMMNNLREYAGKLSEKRRDSVYLMKNTQMSDHQAILSEIARLTVVNYISSSNEYEKVMEQYLHYFLGCNPYNTCYTGANGSRNAQDADTSRDILRQPETDAYFILLLSGV